ncbi:carbamoyltransferase HypF [Helicobacter sp. 10-6591]|nr:carbamoyltransferase HypF [Helicobacter sp. 10-6591]
MCLSSFRFTIHGLVQGVGMRPFLYNAACEFRLKGCVYNTSFGVELELSAKESVCDEFINFVRANLPPLARIDSITKQKIPQKHTKFQILSSKDSIKSAPILSDFGICEDCKREFYDKLNRRHLHLFINCTNCGPRYSIIHSLPYDRAHTSMDAFHMCKDCHSEYTDPKDRRYHAQPISCKACGPRAILRNTQGEILSYDLESIKEVALALQNGQIVAFKGIGGFHLICNALNEKALQDLRTKKHRPHKPLAIMCKDLEQAKEFAHINDRESTLLQSLGKPIVLLDKKENTAFAPSIAPQTNKIGIFLAPSALHLALFEYITFPIVATSANISGEPIIKDYKNLERLNVHNLVLDYDREILNASDESVAFVLQQQPVWLRTSRGLKPSSKMMLDTHSDTLLKGSFLALGSELKNSFAIYHNGLLINSPFIGDIKNPATKQRFFSTLEMFVKSYGIKDFDFVLADLHPHFLHTKHFQKQGARVIKIQHHYAHILSVMSEHKLDCKVLGFSFDGTGYGVDSKIWGGEILLCDRENFTRLGHFDEFKLIGNTSGNLSYLTWSILHKYNLNAPKFLENFNHNKLTNLKQAYENSRIFTSSLGRIFDALSSLVCHIKYTSFEAQAAILLESLYDANLDTEYDLPFENGIINYKEVFRHALTDSPTRVATGFINALARLIVKTAKIYNLPVVLSGGVFQNKALLDRTIFLLQDSQIQYYLPRDTPSNDSSIALGQAYYGIQLLRRDYADNNS